MPREQFRDAASILSTYQFAINHYTEDGLDFSRSVERTAVTTGPAFVLQQGEVTKGTFRYSGTILQQAQFDAMKAYFDACQNRTVFFADFTGTEYEVLITRFNPKRVACAHNPQDPSIPFHYYTYDLEMEIIP